MSTRSITRATLALSIGFAACEIEALDLEGKQCPCSEAFVCDRVRNVCVRIEGAMDARVGLDGDANGAVDRRAPPDDGRSDAPRDAGTNDLGGGGRDARTDEDAGDDPGPTRCDDVLSGAIFCDGFESTDPLGGNLDPWGFALIFDGTGELATVSDPVRHGERALRATTFENGARAAIGVTRDDLPDSGTMWVRMWLYLPMEAEVDSVSLLYVGNGDGSEGLSAQMYGGGRAAQWIGSSGQWHGTESALPRDRWTCIQYRVEIADAGGEIELFVDDESLGVFADEDTLATGGFAGLEAGIEYSGEMQVPLTLYVDEVAVSRTRMPCE